MELKNLVVLITAPNADVGKQIAETLVEQKLAACVNILPGITSIYTWQGSIQEDHEVLLLAKTRADLFEERFIPAVQKLHPYEVPEIIALPIELGAKNYLDWIGEVTIRHS